MLKLPKGLKKKKKGKKSKRKGEEELFTEAELEQYRREHQQQAEQGEPGANQNEEWSKFKDLTTGVDTVLKKTQGDLDRIKSTSFFQRVPAGVKQPERGPSPPPPRPYVEVTAADFPQLAAASAVAADDDRSEYGLTDDESEEDDQDDIFDTSYVEAVERGEVKLAYVPDSPTECQDDDIFDTSHVDALIKGQESKTSKGKQALDIGLAVGVLTGRIDNVTVTTTKRSKRVIPGDLLLESTDQEGAFVPIAAVSEPVETSILDADSDIPITTPIDLSVSLHTSLIQQSKNASQEDLSLRNEEFGGNKEEEELDEFALLAAESLEASAEVTKLEENQIKVEPVLQESWSAFEADKSDSVFAECIVEDQIDVIDPYLDQDDPFDTSFAEAVVPGSKEQQVKHEAIILEDDDDFDPRAEEVQSRLNNRRKSSVRIHLTNPSGLRESITSDEIIDNKEEEQFAVSRDLLGGSTTDLTQLGDSPLDPLDVNDTEIDPFDTTIVDKIVAPGKVELKLLEQELIGSTPAPAPVYRVPSDPDFDPRSEEPSKSERRASRPENLVVGKSVVFNVTGDGALDIDIKPKLPKPVTPYYTRELSITEDISEDAGEAADAVPGLVRTRSNEDLAPKSNYQAKRRHSELPGGRSSDLLGEPADLPTKVLTPSVPPRPPAPASHHDPFDTSFAGDIAPSKTELRLLAKEFSCEESPPALGPGGEPDLLDPSDDIFQVKALTPEPSTAARLPQEEYDPFDTSFAGDLNPGRTELKLLDMNEPAAPVTADVLNPFMMSDPEPAAYNGDNPFATSNPFSDFGGGGFEPAAGDTVPSDLFGGPDPPGGGARHYAENVATTDIFSTPIVDAFSSSAPTKPTELVLTTTTADPFNETGAPPLPTRPLPPETQNLILSVTGQMEFTSSHLLDRIPPTRTPSPVSARDIHSPSPTPEPELAPEIPELPDDAAPPDSFDINRNKPARPPAPPPARPARPPPPPAPARPAPPAVPPAPAAPAPATSVADDINLFDAPAPTLVKPTKEAILSLYSAPKEEEKQIDFLSDDILEDIPADRPDEAAVATDTSPPSHGVVADLAMDCSESMPVESAASDSSPFGDASTETVRSQRASITDKNPFETFVTEDSAASFANSTSNVFDATPEDSFMAPVAEALAATTDVEFTAAPPTTQPTQQNVFGAVATDAFGATTTDAFGTEQTNIFGVDAPATQQQTTDAGWGAESQAIDTDWGAKPQDAQQQGHPNAGWGASPEAMAQDAFPESQDAFDAFSAKFDSTAANHLNTAAWGDDAAGAGGEAGFEAEAFDPFLSMGAPPPPAATPRRERDGSPDSNDDTFSVFIRPAEGGGAGAAVPALAPPPRPAALPESPRANPFDNAEPTHQEAPPEYSTRRGSDAGSGGDTPPTPLFDEDTSAPLEDFPRTKYAGPGWEMHLRQPNKKKITGQRFWKKIFVRLVYQGDNPVVQLMHTAGDKEPFQELPLQACYSVSEVGAQQFDQYGKIFTVKLQYVFYKERPGVRPGQVTKAERLTNKLSQFAAYAIQGDYQGVKEFGSDLRKLGLPVEHAPQVSQLFKLGSLTYEDVKQFSCCVEEALFRLPAHRDRALTYKMEEVQITAVDELYVEQDAEGAVLKQIARVRLFFLGFLSGMPDVELGVNDLRRQGREVVGRHDIIPVVTEEWIRVEDAEFHACVQPDEFTHTQIIKFKPPDACYIELMRFRVRPPKNRELPLQLKAVWCVTGNKVELRADILVPGFASRKLGQVPCEDVAVRFPIPECWIYLFRVEKHFRYGSVKSAHRRTGKIKGIERFLGAVDTLQESLIEVTSGQAKYEHQHRAIVWRMPRLPKEGQGAYTTHNLVCRMALTSYDQIPAELARWAHVEFTMPATQVSHMTVRSVSLQNHDNDPPEKYVRYLARHEYIVGIERTSGQSAPAYALATARDAPPPPPPAAATAPAAPAQPSSDSDSD
ncbi:protein stoned-B-like [Pectinophora gossypiella]|uniref:protein stoned-B-like n=1 Tax=Pectinophora gossypiella TaxID=13191 RepID=UPI00214E22E9|nr:protein stoned-B-like [Pectinophora gossypiella]